MSSNPHVSVEPTAADGWQRRNLLSLRILAGFEIALILATWPLWWGNHSFPGIPLINVLALPQMASRCLVGVLLAACAATVFRPGNQRWLVVMRIAMFAIASILVLANQHRLQAWHWLFMLSLATSVFRAEHRLQLLRSILASVYFCSALSRISGTAHQGMSAAIVDQLLRIARIEDRAIGDGTLEALCHLLNASEFIIGLLLIIPVTRRYGILSAMALHATLIVALGPIGLNHHVAVLLWNLCFLCLIPVVFAGPVSFRNPGGIRSRWACCVAMLFVWLFPLSGLLSIADNWPSWQLYSTRPESWTLWIRDEDVTSLPEALRAHVSEPAPLEDWCSVRLDRWSLAETGSPMYPEDRFQYEIIRRILSELPGETEFRIEISEPHRWLWWRRTWRRITSRSDLELERGRVLFR